MTNDETGAIRPAASLLTPAAPSGIVVVALWGTGAARIVKALFRPVRKRKGNTPAYARAAYGFLEHKGLLLDEVLVLNVGRDRPQFEICCHGGSASAHAILEALKDQGAEICPWSRLIRKRSLQHDLLKDLLESRAGGAAALLAHLYSGSLRQAFSSLEEVLDTMETEEKSERVKSAQELALELEESFEQGRFLHRPPKVVLMGPTNAGKSTLFNAVLGEHRVLTSRIPGTTRDPVEATFLLQGFPVRLFDLPGDETMSLSALAQEAQRMAKSVVKDADLQVLVHACTEGQEPLTPEIKEKCLKRIIVFNKADLVNREKLEQLIRTSGEERIDTVAVVSALKEQGISSFLEKTGKVLGISGLANSFAPMVINKRQLAYVRKTRQCLEGRRYAPAFRKRLRAYIAE